MIDFSKFDNIIDMTMYFNTDEKCKQAITEARWGVGDEQDVECPYCHEHHCVVRKDGKFRCKHCGKNFSCLVKTIFHNTSCRLLSGLLQCTLSAATRRVSAAIS